jgi:hypothetical protein
VAGNSQMKHKHTACYCAKTCSLVNAAQQIKKGKGSKHSRAHMSALVKEEINQVVQTNQMQKSVIWTATQEKILCVSVL